MPNKKQLLANVEKYLSAAAKLINDPNEQRKTKELLSNAYDNLCELGPFVYKDNNAHDLYDLYEYLGTYHKDNYKKDDENSLDFLIERVEQIKHSIRLQFEEYSYTYKSDDEDNSDNESTLEDTEESETDEEERVTDEDSSDLSSAPLITNEYLFPRCEYYSRFQGTTAFAMDEPDYWGTYHRSEGSRFFSIAGSRKEAQFSSPFVKKTKGVHSFSAHTGGFHSPFSIDKYSGEIKLEKRASEGTVNVRDRLLLYKNRMAKTIVTSFEDIEENEQKFQKKSTKKKFLRPIVYTENEYPCVLVALPVLNSTEMQTEATKYWEQHPKPFQRLLLCSFIALLNVEAIRQNIPIEMVLRASFGHNLPSICETDRTFRINVGVIPKCYANLIGKTLSQLNKVIGEITDETSQAANFSANFLAKVRSYNAKKLKKAINEKKRYKTLRNTADFKDAENSDEAFDRLYKSFCKKNEGKKSKGRATFVPVNLKDKTIWEVIRQAGDSMGKSVLSECFRQKGTEDWFVNQVMDAILSNSENPIEIALTKLLECISYGEAVTMNYKKIHKDLKCKKRQFKDPSFEGIYSNDAEFSEIVNILCGAFLIKKPSKALYSALEQGGVQLLSTYRGSETISDTPDFGSDSEFSDELTDEESDEESEKKSHISHIKLRVCAGMKAILLAQYGALSYLRSKGVSKYTQDVEQMYYEVEEALKLVKEDELAINKVRAKIGSKVLHFDLNHCNAANVEDNKQLEEKLGNFNPTVVILDYTSSTALNIETALRQCFSNKNVALVMLVDSGLKNSQGGSDLNPYGEVRICSRDRGTIKSVEKVMRKGLSEKDKLTQEAHEMVRVCKRRGMALSLFGLFKTNKSRFQAIPQKEGLPNKKIVKKKSPA